MPVQQVRRHAKVEPEPRLRHPAGQDAAVGDGTWSAATSRPTAAAASPSTCSSAPSPTRHGPHAAAIVLSGADGDGAIGIKRIKERGGLTIAQDPDEAEHAGMPRSAIATGMVDWVLPVGDMPARLAAYRAAPRQAQAAARGRPAAGQPAARAGRRSRGGAARGPDLPARAAPAATSATTSGRRSCAASRGA